MGFPFNERVALLTALCPDVSPTENKLCILKTSLTALVPFEFPFLSRPRVD